MIKLVSLDVFGTLIDVRGGTEWRDGHIAAAQHVPLGYLAAHEGHSESTLRRAIVMGSTLASFCVEGFSLDRLLTLTRAEIDDRFRLFKQLTHFETL